MLCQKTRQKLDEKIREIDRSYWCLHRFDEFWICILNYRKRKLFELAKTCIGKLVKSLFSAGFSLLEPPCIAQSGLDCLKLVKAVQLMVGQQQQLLCVCNKVKQKSFFHHFVICCTSNSVTKPTLKQLDCVEECEKLVCAFILITLEPF